MAVNPNTFDPGSIVTNEDTKFCILPGQEPITLSTEHGGHGCRIGEEPRTVPLFFHQEAIAKGAYTESQFADLQSRLSGGTAPVGHPGGALGSGPGLPAGMTSSQPPLMHTDADDDDFPSPPGTPMPPADPQRSEQIKAAVIELLNTGNPHDFTNSGAPKVEALKDKLGFEVTGPERDAAYEAAKG